MYFIFRTSSLESQSLVSCSDSQSLVSRFSDLSHQRCAAQHLRDAVRIAVGRRPAVLQVAVAILADLPRNANAGAPIRDSGREFKQTGCLVQPRQSPLVVLSVFRIVSLDVLQMFSCQLLDRFVDVPENGVKIRSDGVWVLCVLSTILPFI